MTTATVTEEARNQIIRMYVHNPRTTMRFAAERVGIHWRQVQEIVKQWRASQASGQAEHRGSD